MSQDASPHKDEQAERAVIGAVLHGATRQQVDGLRAEDFTGPRVYVWQAVEHLLSQGKEVNDLSLAEVLKHRGRLVEVGGPSAFARMTLMDPSDPTSERRFWTPSTLCQALSTVKDKSARRRLEATLEAARRNLYDPNLTPERVAADAAVAVLAAGPKRDDDEPGDVDLWEINDRWDSWNQMTEEERVRNEPYLPMPWAWMREAGFYGFPQNLSVVAGPSGMGKTATLSSCMAYWLRVLPHKGAVIGLEDGTAWLDERWLAKSLGIDYAAVGCSRLNQWQEQKYAEHMEHIGPILREKLRKYRRPRMTAKELLTRCRRWIDEGVKWIVLDHGLRVIYEPDGRTRDDKIIGQTMDDLANMAMLNKVHIIEAWHLNRDAEDEEAPTLKSLKESGYLDAAARFIWFLWRRNGRTMTTVGKATKVAPVGLHCELEWDGRSGMFDTNRGRVVDFAAEAVAAREAAKAEKEAQRQQGKSRLFSGNGVRP